MSAASRIRYAYYAYLAKPKSERTLYRQIRSRHPHRIVELGVGTARRTQRMLQVVARYASGPIEYTGIDLFEARSVAAESMKLKDAHRLLKPLADRVRLFPGDPFSALSATANMLTGTDLLIISADQDAEALSRAWFYVPRMLTENTLVLHEQPVSGQPSSGKLGETHLVPVSRVEIEALAAAQMKSRRRAA